MTQSLILAVLHDTPWWVFAVFAYLLWTGVVSLRSRTLNLVRVYLAPAVFVCLGVWVALSRVQWGHPPGLIYLSAATAGAFLGATTGPSNVEGDRSRLQAVVPGSWIPLARNLLVFIAIYLLNVAAALNPTHREDYGLAAIGVSGFAIGYFLGWAGRFTIAYFKIGVTAANAV